jgi:hypothetical protein
MKNKLISFLKGVWRSKTMYFAAALGVLGAIEGQRATLEPVLRQHGGMVFGGIGVAVAVLRIFTTVSLLKKGA